MYILNISRDERVRIKKASTKFSLIIDKRSTVSTFEGVCMYGAVIHDKEASGMLR